MKLKLYVWTDFYPDYSPGLAFAIAETEQEAQGLIRKEFNLNHEPDWGGPPKVHEIEKVAYFVLGGS